MNPTQRAQAWCEAAIALADCLARENDALSRIDYVGATALGRDKQRALDALEAAHAAMGPEAFSPPELKAVAARLDALAHENRQLLKRAMTVQSRVIDCFARAMRGLQPAPRYGARGTIANTRSVSPVSFVARA